jgi:hypothetical protein
MFLGRLLTLAVGLTLTYLPNYCLAGPQNDCFKHASLAFGATEEQAAEVCEGADSVSPAQCFRNAVTVKGISPEIGTQLCKFAVNDSPADCFRTATTLNGLSEKSALSLCKTRLRYTQ